MCVRVGWSGVGRAWVCACVCVRACVHMVGDRWKTQHREYLWSESVLETIKIFDGLICSHHKQQSPCLIFFWWQLKKKHKTVEPTVLFSIVSADVKYKPTSLTS